MRINNVLELRERIRNSQEPLPELPPVPYSPDSFRLLVHCSAKRRFLDSLAPTILTAMQARFRRRLGCELSIRNDMICIGERWACATAWKRMSQLISDKATNSVLIQGCGVGDGTVQQWLRAGVKTVRGVELMNLTEVWEQTVPILRSAYKADVDFRRGSVDAIPFEDSSFDVVSSGAVYEHVYNLESAAAETSRVLVKGGLAYHAIGPLYFGYSGDHCISEYGPDAGYDHLLLPDDEYRRRVGDDGFYAQTADPHMAFWAKSDKFSFARPSEYFNAVEPYFDIEYSLVIIDPTAIAFRDRQCDRWNSLISKGLNPTDLLVKGIHLILRKR